MGSKSCAAAAIDAGEYRCDRRVGADHEVAGAAFSATKGELAWPPLAMFRAVPLAVWYGLSDVKLAYAVQDRASPRRFCGFSGAEMTPDRKALVRPASC